eukprot:scaffold3998_cov153-Skeletonema_dohrnii-CCMP3373.AAC.22
MRDEKASERLQKICGVDILSKAFLINCYRMKKVTVFALEIRRMNRSACQWYARRHYIVAYLENEGAVESMRMREDGGLELELDTINAAP